MHDGTGDGVLSLLESKLESCRRLDVWGAPKVLNVVPHERGERLEAHDFFTKAEGVLSAKHGWLVICRAAREAGSELAVRGRTISESAAAWVMQSRWRAIQLRVSGLLWV